MLRWLLVLMGLVLGVRCFLLFDFGFCFVGLWYLIRFGLALFLFSLVAFCW